MDLCRATSRAGHRLLMSVAVHVIGLRRLRGVSIPWLTVLNTCGTHDVRAIVVEQRASSRRARCACLMYMTTQTIGIVAHGAAGSYGGLCHPKPEDD